MSPVHTQKTESIWGPGAMLSLTLHAGLAALIVYGAWLGKYLPLGGAHPGTAPGGSMHANLVSQVPGGAIPMPAPVLLPTKNRLANDLPGASVSLPRSRPRAPRHSVALPSINPEKLARQQAKADLQKLTQADPQRHDDRVHYGAGGAASFSYTTKAQGAGAGGGMSFGDANFGNLYTDWVNHLRDRLQFYWNEQPRDPSLAAGQKVTVTLTVHSAGNIDSLHYLNRSSSIQVNSMAFQAIEQMGAQEKFPLPPGYGKDFLVVNVTFEINN